MLGGRGVFGDDVVPLFTNRVKVRVLEGIWSREAGLGVKDKDLVEEVDSFRDGEVSVLGGDELGKPAAGRLDGGFERGENVWGVLWVRVKPVAGAELAVGVHPEELDNDSHLGQVGLFPVVGKVFGVKERVAAKDERGHDAAKGPHVDGVVVVLVVEKHLGCAVGPCPRPLAELAAADVKRAKPPVDEAELGLCGVKEDVAGLDVAVDDPVRVRVVEGQQELVEVGPGVQVVKRPEDLFVVGVVDIVKDQDLELLLAVHKHVQELDDVEPLAEETEHADLVLDQIRLFLFRLDRLDHQGLSRLPVLGQVDVAKPALADLFVPQDLVLCCLSPPQLVPGHVVPRPILCKVVVHPRIHRRLVCRLGLGAQFRSPQRLGREGERGCSGRRRV